MRLRTIALLALTAFAATEASAQAVGTQSWIPNLAGVYRCVNHCVGPGVVRIMQRGRALTLRRFSWPACGGVDRRTRPHLDGLAGGGRLLAGWLHHPVCGRNRMGASRADACSRDRLVIRGKPVS